jgi:hypothetical protein
MLELMRPPACQGASEDQESPAELQRQKIQERSEWIGKVQDAARGDSLDSEYVRKKNLAVLLRKSMATETTGERTCRGDS